jgi:hypothetical protein
MKGSAPYHAENYGFAPRPGKASKLLTFLPFSESEGGQSHPSCYPQFFFHGDGAGGFPIIGTGGIEVFTSSPSLLNAKSGLRVLNL